MPTTKKILEQFENRFKDIAGLDLDISHFPLNDVSNSQVETDRNKSKSFSEVFTPLWLVDEMIQQINFKHYCFKTIDLCAGFGQFSIRLMRYYFDNFKNFNISDFIKKNHYFAELQLSSCYKLIHIFGPKLNLFIGDACKLNKLPKTAKGIWFYLENLDGWVCLTNSVINIFYPNGLKKDKISEEQFVEKVELLVKYYNERYKLMEITLEQMTRDKKSRLVLFSELNKATADTSQQVVDTPEVIVRELVDRVDDLEHKSILVLFNCEIIEYLVHNKNIDPKDITYMADVGSELEAKFVKKVYGVDYKLFNQRMDNFRSQLGGRIFDVCFSNPPYNMGIHLKILSNLLGISNNFSIAREYVIVHPANWLIDIKGKENLFINFKNLISKKLKSVKIFNGNFIFGIDLFYPCVITHIDINHIGDINVEYFSDKYLTKNINDITKYSKEWNDIVSKFYFKVKSYIKENSSVWQHNKRALSPNKEYCQLARIRGHVIRNQNNIFSDDFYTLVMRNSENNKGLRKDMDKRPGPTFEFNSINERDNFLNYLKTDFVRFCLSLFKIKSDVDCGEMAIIPWMDVSKIWDDEKLFNYFDVNKETQDYIRSFLPDYYGIRK